jgi:hypothetical protein
MEEKKLRAFGSKMLRRIFGPKRNEVTRKIKELHMRSFMIFLHPLLLQANMLHLILYRICNIP